MPETDVEAQPTPVARHFPTKVIIAPRLTQRSSKFSQSSIGMPT